MQRDARSVIFSLSAISHELWVSLLNGVQRIPFIIIIITNIVILWYVMVCYGIQHRFVSRSGQNGWFLERFIFGRFNLNNEDEQSTGNGNDFPFAWRFWKVGWLPSKRSCYFSTVLASSRKKISLLSERKKSSSSTSQASWSVWTLFVDQEWTFRERNWGAVKRRYFQPVLFLF